MACMNSGAQRRIIIESATESQAESESLLGAFAHVRLGVTVEGILFFF